MSDNVEGTSPRLQMERLLQDPRKDKYNVSISGQQAP
jgi:hypothetical protein